MGAVMTIMKLSVCLIAVSLGSLYIMQLKSSTTPNRSYAPLQEPSETLAAYNEIAVSYNKSMVKHFNSLTPEKRVFFYYMYRATLAGQQAYRQQLHRHGPAIIHHCETILKNSDKLRAMSPTPLPNLDAFLADLTTYAVYVWTNHSQYFHKENSNEKRTPERLGLTNLTPDAMVAAMTALGDAHAADKIAGITRSMFETTYEPTLVVPGSIDQSASALYVREDENYQFTDADYDNLQPEDRGRLNAAFLLEVDAQGNRTPKAVVASIGGLYGKEMTVVCAWLTKAHEYATAHADQFDSHLINSIPPLVQYFTTGDEEQFKVHTKEWIQSASKDLDFTFGFIEDYSDPKNQRGMFEADVTVKTVDLEKLNALLPSLEAQFPFPDEFKRDFSNPEKMGTPNASINAILFAGGELGPIKATAAYCLPNYEEIRSEFGSKQIIYEIDKGLGEMLNKEKSLTLGYLKAQADWIRVNDPNRQLDRDLWKVHVILHETIGHGSGKLATHTFRDGDIMTIDNVTYNVGDTIPVTNKNLPQFLSGYGSALEELRAEILALYMSVYNYDELAAAGLMAEWPSTMNKDELIDANILSMADTIMGRYRQQDVNATEISGAHARANCTLTHFLIDGRGLAIQEEERVVDDETYTVLGCVITDRDKVIAGIKELAQLVQQIKSTGDTQGVRALIDTYGKNPYKPEYIKILRRNTEAVVGKLKAHSLLFPHFSPIVDASGAVVDINAVWPKDIVEQNLHLSKIALSTK